jgi:hypothetical protein
VVLQMYLFIRTIINVRKEYSFIFYVCDFYFYYPQVTSHLAKRKMELEQCVDKILEGKRKKGKQVPDRETFIQEELAKASKPSYFMVNNDLSKIKCGCILVTFLYEKYFLK